MKKDGQITIFKLREVDDPKKGLYRVTPGKLVASAFDIVTFKVNRSVGYRTRITPPPGIFEPDRASFELDPGQSKSLLVCADASDGVYPYGVVVLESQGETTAHGASDPEIIIDN